MEPATVLLPLDGSELSDRILSVLDRIPRDGLRVVLMRVVGRSASMARTDAASAAALEHLEGLERRLRDRGVRAVHMLTVGTPAAQILEAIEVVQPTWVGMATHGRGGLARTLRGSVAEQVLERCPVPLLLANPAALPFDPGAGFAKILVPLAVEPVTARVLPWVASAALVHRSEVVLLHVGTAERPVSAGEAILAPYRARLLEDGVEKVTVHAVVGDPVAEILAEQARTAADVLVLASHSKAKGVTRWLGTVSQGVLRRATCPLFMVRVAAPEE